MKKHVIAALAVTTSLFAFAPVAGATTTAPSGFNVTATLTSACAITSGPADVAFTYTSFQGGAATGTGGAFQVSCTNTLPYTMALDATSGTVIGLNYTLSLSAAGGTGNGAAQSYTVNGSMVSGQAGSCGVASCSGSQGRTLTVTY